MHMMDIVIVKNKSDAILDLFLLLLLLYALILLQVKSVAYSLKYTG